MANPQTKQRLLEEFLEMRSMEETARDYYAEIINDPRIADDNVKRVFTGIRKDEIRHIEIVDKILSLIRNNL